VTETETETETKLGPHDNQPSKQNVFENYLETVLYITVNNISYAG